MKSHQFRDEYISRINRVLDYIESHLDKPLCLNELSEVANFSPFYFHRIFKAIVGETINSFIQRVRIEKAAVKLISDRKKSITEIALDCGFSGSAVFARSFKEYYGTSATSWRNDKELRNSKIRKINGNISKQKDNKGKDYNISSMYFESTQNKLIWRIKMVDQKNINVEVKELQEINVAYVRHIGPYKGDSKLFENLFNKLFRWAGPRGLLQFPETKCICVYHDDPEITNEEKLRTSCCITVKPDTEVNGEVGKMVIPSGKYAAARFELKVDEFQQAWDLVCGGWLPESGFQPDNRPCFEIYYNDHKAHPEGKFIVDICFPVKPL